jgi:hypothetical protein
MDNMNEWFKCMKEIAQLDMTAAIKIFNTLEPTEQRDIYSKRWIRRGDIVPVKRDLLPARFNKINDRWNDKIVNTYKVTYQQNNQDRFMTIEITFSRSNTPRDRYDHFDAVEDYLIDYHNDLEMDAGFKVEFLNSKIAV